MESRVKGRALRPGPQTDSTSTPPSPTRSQQAPCVLSIRRLALFIALNALLVNFAVWGCNRLLAAHYPNPQSGRGLTATAQVLTGVQGKDSLGVMLPAVHAFLADPSFPVYKTVFFAKREKFQYPLTSLLPVYALVRMGFSDAAILRLFKVASYLCVAATLWLCYALALRLLRRRQTVSRPESALLATTVLLAGLFYYPLMSALSLGQIQTLLTLGFTVALLCWLSGREMAAGVLIGLMTAVKPQYGLFFLWALIRRKFGAALAGLGCLAATGLASLAVFGWQNNLQYLDVLRFIAARGEAYYENQSVNGLLNRLLFNGNNLIWHPHNFAPENRLVYLGTTIASLLLLGLALVFPWGKRRRGGVADFACLVLAATMASPVAWVHHYAILLPVLVWLWCGESNLTRSRLVAWSCAAAYILMSDKLGAANALATVPFWNIVQSYFYFGAILVFLLLLRRPDALAPSSLSPAEPEIAP